MGVRQGCAWEWQKRKSGQREKWEHQSFIAAGIPLDLPLGAMLRSRQGTFPVPVHWQLPDWVEVGHREETQSITPWRRVL